MNEYNLGFETLNDEISVGALPVSGEIPPWLSGTLVRNGPAKFEVGDRKLNHWFDGFSMLHSFSFSNGAVSYINKFLQSKAYQHAKKNNAIGYSEFATDPCRSFFKRALTGFAPKTTDNALVNVSRINDAFVALTETPAPIAFDKETLETVGCYDYEDTLKGETTTAHPHYDAERGETVNVVTSFGRKSYYNIYRLRKHSNTREVVASIPVSNPAYMHSFGMTKNYIVLAEYPFTLVPLHLLLFGKPFFENLVWKPERGTTFLLVHRDTGEVKKVVADSFFSFHHINAFETQDGIVVDLVGFPDASIVKALCLENMRTGDVPIPAGQMRRYTLGWDETKATYETIVDDAIELPRINYEKVSTKPYSVVYGAGAEPAHPNNFLNRLVKVNIKERRVAEWREENCYPGEPVFVSSPEAEREDEGVVLSVVLNAHTHRSFLLVLDAASFEEKGRAEVPHHIPFGFHGHYFS